MLWFVKHIIGRMSDLAKRWGPAFFVTFPVLLGLSLTALYLYLKDFNLYQYIIFILLAALALFCLTLAIMALIYDIKEARRKDRDFDAAKEYEALKESFRRMHPEWTDEQVEIASRGY